MGGGSIAIGSNRVIRGGSWNNTGNNMQVGNLNNNNPYNENNNNGFRLSSTGALLCIAIFTDMETEVAQVQILHPAPDFGQIKHN